MYSKDLNFIINAITKGDTSTAEKLFTKPGGKKYLQNLVLILINTMPHEPEDKEEIFRAFVKMLNTIEKRIKRQKEGEEILEQVYN